MNSEIRDSCKCGHKGATVVVCTPLQHFLLHKMLCRVCQQQPSSMHAILQHRQLREKEKTEMKQFETITVYMITPSGRVYLRDVAQVFFAMMMNYTLVIE